MKLNDLIDKLLLKENLTTYESKVLFEQLFSDKIINEPFAKLILMLLAIKGESGEELAGLVQTIRRIEKPVRAPGLPNLADGCGTGGDGTNTFNISTLASLVAAGAGAHVAKHGNRSISSQCGSADLLETLGVKIDAPLKQMLKALKHKNCRIAYFHAPLYHQSFKKVQPVRMKLQEKYQTRTIFNLVGPLTNPLQPKRQVIGVFRKDLVKKVAETSKKLGLKRTLVIRSADGMDELTTTAKTDVAELKNGSIKQYSVSPAQFGFRMANRKELKGGKADVNKKIALKILSGEDKTARRDVVLLNAAAILYVSGKAKNLKEGVLLARKSIDSGMALKTLKNLIRISHGS
ncbi:MAG TPA: anthranilate phosphoribosyltransferase [Candidatus Omnitrophota bacterium]|nr:anthranilate phosphoribosyltransferase [Candidatus Omnitrophota bacterium]